MDMIGQCAIRTSMTIWPREPAPIKHLPPVAKYYVTLTGPCAVRSDEKVNMKYKGVLSSTKVVRANHLKKHMLNFNFMKSKDEKLFRN